jgi:nitrous oxide reductase accessory protein NosL
MMDRCSRWYDVGIALTVDEIVAAVALRPGCRVEPLVPRIWETCPVCGRFVAPHREWTAQIVYDDGIALFFDGAKDLFRYLLSPQRQGRVPIAGVFVTNYTDHQVIAARDAFYVAGSDVSGPAGAELVPHRSMAEAREFASDHFGTSVVRFEQVETALLSGLS